MKNDWKQKNVRLKVHLKFGRSVRDRRLIIVPHRPIHKLKKASGVIKTRLLNMSASFENL